MSYKIELQDINIGNISNYSDYSSSDVSSFFDFDDDTNEWMQNILMGEDELSANNSQVGGDHYTNMDIQPWEAMEAWLTPEEYRGYHKGVVISYLARERSKGGDVDIGKATHHMNKLNEFINEKKGNV